MRLGHLRLDVADLDRQTAFYTDVLGLSVRERATDAVSHYAFLTDHASIPEGPDSGSESGAGSGMHHRLVLRQARDGSAPGPTGRFDHFAWEAETPAELLAVVERLRERGVEVDLQDAQIAWQCYFHDPEGTRVEVYVDRRAAPDGAPLWRGRQEDLDEGRLRGAAGGRNQE